MQEYTPLPTARPRVTALPGVTPGRAGAPEGAGLVLAATLALGGLGTGAAVADTALSGLGAEPARAAGRPAFAARGEDGAPSLDPTVTPLAPEARASSPAPVAGDLYDDLRAAAAPAYPAAYAAASPAAERAWDGKTVAQGAAMPASAAADARSLTSFNGMTVLSNAPQAGGSLDAAADGAAYAHATRAAWPPATPQWNNPLQWYNPRGR